MSANLPASVRLRDATAADLEAMHRIYAHHVLCSAASFELTPPDLEEFSRRIQAVRDAGLPWIVAEAEGEVKGYAYASTYRPRPAYRFTVEDSVYVDPSAQRRGIGSELLKAVIKAATAAGKRQMLAVITRSANSGSVALHEKLGFRHVGALAEVGFKFDCWLDTLLMQRPLIEQSEPRQRE